jgi:ABC-2 type transport system permease protein
MLKALRETWLVTLLFGLGLGLVEALLAVALPTLQRQLGDLLERLGFVQQFLKVLVGMDVAGPLGPDLFVALRWIHPVVLALVWAHAIIHCTRVPAGEVDRGTIDVLLAMPVSRWGLYVSESVVWMASAGVVLTLGLAGSMVGERGNPPETQPTPAHVGIVLVNLACLYGAVGGVAWLVSALSDHRGRAIAVVFAVVVASFLINYLAQLWKPAERLSVLSVLTYYRPLFILRDGAWPSKDLAILGGTALVTWSAAGWTFSRRDLATT